MAEQSDKQYEFSESHLGPDSFTAGGRRTFCDYRDLGIGAATHGDVGVTVTKLNAEPTSTGWHYHDCDLQVIYVLKGSIDLAFGDGRIVHVAAGGCLNIPPRMVHNELNTTPDYEVIEITRPAKMSTTLVDDPALAASASSS